METTPPEERIYRSVSSELRAPKRCTLNPSIASTSSSNFEIQEIQVGS